MTRLTTMARSSAAVLIGAMTIASMATPGSASVKTGTEQFARQVCQSVIRVRPGAGAFDGCVLSLADTLRSIGRDRTVAEARDACFARDLKPGSTDLDLCLLRAKDAKAGSDDVKLPDAASAMSEIADDPQSSESYFVVSSRTKTRREQQACALLGLDPAFDAFANCVANLQGALQAIDAPDV